MTAVSISTVCLSFCKVNGDDADYYSKTFARVVRLLYQGSQYVSISNAVYDLFLTSAVTDGLKLWDLRSNRFVCALSLLAGRQIFIYKPTVAYSVVLCLLFCALQ